MATKNIKIHSLLELKKWIESIAQQFKSMNLVLLKGEMGSGKTTFIHELVQALGGRDVSSPTFTFHQSYKISGGLMHHFDLYRINNEDELETIGIWEHLQNTPELTFIEWPERLGTRQFPNHWQVIEIDIQVTSEMSRDFNLSGFFAK